MKKFVLALAALLLFAAGGWADNKVEVIEYKCLVCGKTFFSFKGDDLMRREINGNPKQYDKLYQLYDKGRHIEQCRNNFKHHRFDRRNTRSVTPCFINQTIQCFVIIKDGGAVNTSLWTWECLVCHKNFYSFGDNLNVRAWHDQPNWLRNVKSNRSIYKCSDEYILGHVFKFKSKGSVSSQNIANLLENIYFVRQ